MAILRKRLGHKTESGETLVLHFETSASIVLMSDGSNVEDKLNNVSNVVAEKMAPLEEAVNKLNGGSDAPGSVAYIVKTDIEPLKAAVATLNADVNTEGSVDHKINEAKTPLQTAINTLNGAANVTGSVANSIKTATDPLNAALETLNGDKTTAGSVAKAVEDRAKPIEEQLASLLGTSGDGSGGGSIDDRIAAAIAGVVGDSPESFDTLVEFYNWTQTHEQDATSMNEKITKLQSDLTAALARIQALEDANSRYTFQAV